MFVKASIHCFAICIQYILFLIEPESWFDLEKIKYIHVTHELIINSIIIASTIDVAFFDFFIYFFVAPFSY
jgi:hypothetical protein